LAHPEERVKQISGPIGVGLFKPADDLSPLSLLTHSLLAKLAGEIWSTLEKFPETGQESLTSWPIDLGQTSMAMAPR